ncbi:MAG: hypothetical protein N2652_01705 [Kiritimatiellae bacterium]|nr:hypothetical protein [Kiritimatiellia bacterium]
MTPKHARMPAAPAALLAEWLRGWRLYRALGAGESPAEISLHRGAPVAGDETAPPEEGQVRLLAPATAATACRAWFVAVLERADLTGWYVAPFGVVPVPAFESEVRLSERRPPYLRTLCLWNTRRVEGRRLEEFSWLCARLSPSELRAARAVWRAWRHAAPLPAFLRARVGPPLAHPRDPRREYETEEAAAWDEACAFLEGSLAREAEEVPSLYAIPEAERLMAAEPEATTPPPKKKPDSRPPRQTGHTRTS